MTSCVERYGRQWRPGQGLWSRLAAWNAVRRQRLALSRLTPELLDDIGLTEAEVRRETAKWPWMP